MQTRFPNPKSQIHANRNLIFGTRLTTKISPTENCYGPNELCKTRFRSYGQISSNLGFRPRPLVIFTGLLGFGIWDSGNEFAEFLYCTTCYKAHYKAYYKALGGSPMSHFKQPKLEVKDIRHLVFCILGLTSSAKDYCPGMGCGLL